MCTMPERLAYTVNEAAAIAGVNRRTLYKERQAGKLTMVIVQGRTMIKADELRRWVNSWTVHESTGHAGRARKEPTQPKLSESESISAPPRPTREQIRAADDTGFLEQLEAVKGARQATQQTEQEEAAADDFSPLLTRLRSRREAKADPEPDKVDANPGGNLWSRLGLK
jgi:hypothetical protein